MEIAVRAAGGADVDRHNNFDFLRFFLATAVVFAHSFHLLGRKHTHIGLVAVMGFFGLSGFLVTQSWLRKRSVLDFFQKRVLRIYPGFAAACLFDYLVVGPIATTSGARYFARIDPAHLLAQILLLRHTTIRGVFSDLPVKTVNGSLWTVPYEFVCYILLAIVGVLGFTRHRSRLLALGLLVWGLYVVLPVVAVAVPIPAPGVRRAELVLRFVSSFLAGAIFFLYRERIVMTPVTVSAAVVLLALSTLSVWSFRLVWPIGFPYVLLWIACHTGIPLQGWGRAGDFSYGIYIYAFPIQQLLVKFARPSLNPYTLFLAAMTIVLPVAVLSWFLIEKPFLRLKYRSTGPRDTPNSGHIRSS